MADAQIYKFVNHISPVITHFSSLLLVFVLLDFCSFILKPVSFPAAFKAENILCHATVLIYLSNLCLCCR